MNRPVSLFLAVLAAAGLVAGQGRALERAAPATPPPLPRVVVEAPPSPEEADVARLVKEAVAAKALPVFKDRTVVEMGVREAVEQKITQNLTIQERQKREDIVKAAWMETRAVFDPIFTFSVAHNENATMDRSEMARRFKKATIPRVFSDGSVEHVLPFDEEAQQSSQLKELVFREPRLAHYERQKVDANKQGPFYGPDRSQTYSLNLDQQLPWGPTLNLAVASVRHMTFWSVEEWDELAGKLRTRKGEYDRPWTTSATVNFQTPLPLLKGSGLNAPADVQLQLARYNEERAYFDTRTVINSTLLQVDVAYWELVRAAAILRATVANRKMTEEIQAEIKKLFDDRAITIYGMHQADAEINSVKVLEAGAWDTYVRASNNLSNLLNLDRTILLVPKAYAPRLGEHQPWTEKEAYDLGLSKRPEILAEKTGQQATALLVRYQQNQNRPNIKFNAQWGLSQSSNPYGYTRFDRSVSRLLSPDTAAQTYGLLYTLPAGNRAVEADLEAARAQDGAQGILIKSLGVQIEQDVADAVVGLLSAKARVEIAQKALTLAEEALKDARAAHSGKQITQYELLTKNRDLLQAQYAKIAADIDYKQAETRLLAAEGILANRFPSMTSTTQFDKLRLQALAATKSMRFFGPVAP